jgi:hypothetical protein
MSALWLPHRESRRRTLVRTGTIALVGGAVLTLASGHGGAWWPIATVMMLWPSLGGHFVELWFLNWLRPRLAGGRVLQLAARMVVWFVAGCGLALGMRFTATAFTTPWRAQWPPWWLGGVAFIGLELVAHAVLQAKGRPSVYNGRG